MLVDMDKVHAELFRREMLALRDTAQLLGDARFSTMKDLYSVHCTLCVCERTIFTARGYYMSLLESHVPDFGPLGKSSHV